MPRGANIGMGCLDRKKKWGKVSGPEKEKAKEESRGHCRGCEFCLHPVDLSLAQGIQAGPVSLTTPGAELLGVPSTLRPREAVSYLVRGTFYFLPVLSLSSQSRRRDLAGRNTFL